MKSFLTFFFLLIGLITFSQRKAYNVYEIDKGEILKSDYFYLDHFYNNLLIAVPLKDNIDYDYADLTGVIDLEEKEILPFKYRNIEKLRDDYELFKEKIPLLAISNGSSGRAIFQMNNNNFQQLTDFKFLKFRPFLFDGNYLMAYDGYSQILNLNDATILKTKFVEIEPLTSDLISTKNMDYKWGVINRKGDTILTNTFDRIRAISNVLASLEKRDSIGVLNNEGTLIIPPLFKKVELSKTRILMQTFNNGKKIKIDDNLQLKFSKWTTTIKKNGKIQAIINSINNEDIQQIGLFGAYDFDGKLKIPFAYDLLTKGINNEIIAYKNGKVGVISENGQTIIDFKYDSIEPIFETYYVVENDNGQGLFTTNNKNILQVKSQKIFLNSKNEILYTEKGRWNKILLADNFEKISVKTTNLKADYDFSYLKSYSDLEKDYMKNTDIFVVEDLGRYGIIDKNQKIIVPIVNNKKLEFFNGKYFDFDRKYTAKGIELKEIDLSRNYYDDDKSFKKTIIAKKGEKYGVVNMDGKIVVPFKYSYIQNIDGQKFIVTNSGKSIDIKDYFKATERVFNDKKSSNKNKTKVKK